jgi:carboxypeptidase C (cathepsin A)
MPSLRSSTASILTFLQRCGIHLEALVAEVEQFAMGEYAHALAAGSELSANARSAVAERLHQYTGLPLDYILKADLRIDGGEFRQNLRGAEGMATGRLDSRFSEYRFYESGHMVYAKDTSLKMLHDNVAGFIRRTSNLHD